jgi:hypothetical protein
VQLDQIYTTSVFDSDSPLGLEVVVIPSRSIEGWEQLLRDPRDIPLRLGLVPSGIVASDETHNALRMVFLRSPELPPPFSSYWDDEFYDVPWRHRFQRRVDQFVDTVYHEQLVPFEQSPLAASSIEALAKTAKYVTVAWVAGDAIHHNPWLLIATPAGVVVCAALEGAYRGIRKAAEEHVYEFLRPKKKRGRRPR